MERPGPDLGRPSEALRAAIGGTCAATAGQAARERLGKLERSIREGAWRGRRKKP